MLIRNHIILIFRIDGLILGSYIDLVVGKFVFTEILEEICISRTCEVYVGKIRVFRLEMGLGGRFEREEGERYHCKV